MFVMSFILLSQEISISTRSLLSWGMEKYNITRALFVPSLVLQQFLPWGHGVDNMPIHYLEALHRVHFTFNEVQRPKTNGSCPMIQIGLRRN